MKSILNRLRALRAQYAVFITTVILTIVLTQLIIQYDLKRQNQDARLINIAGRQRMLSQRISKLALYIQLELRTGQMLPGRIDTLRNLISNFESIHSKLKATGPDKELAPYKNEVIDSLLNGLTVPLNKIVNAAKMLIVQPTLSMADSTVQIMAQNELSFLWLMERTVHAYQEEAERKLNNLKLVELALAALSIAIIMLEFVYIFLPLIRDLKRSNEELVGTNNELSTTNEELQATEEELRSNLDYITTLQNEATAREKQFREVVENASDMIYELDEQGKFFYANPVMEAISEFSKQELSQKNYWDLVHPDFQEQVIRFYQDQRKKKIEHTYLELPILSKNGFEIWVGQNVRMHFQDSWVSKVSVVARDITVLFKAREALQKSEELFRTLSENAPVGIYQLDVNGKAIFINKRLFEIAGLDQNSSQRESEDAIHPDDRTRVLKAWKDAITNHHRLNIQFRYRNEKQITWVTNKLHPLINEQGIFSGFVGTMSDITALVEAQQRAEESERLYKLISTNSRDLISLYNNGPEPVRTYISPSVKEILGYEPSEMIGRSSIEFIEEADRKKMVEEVHPRTLSGQSAYVEYRTRKKDGTLVWLESASSPYFDEHGKMIGFQTSARDITERKRAEESLRQSEERFRMLAEKAPVGIFQTDQRGKAIYMNERWGEIAGIHVALAMENGWANLIYEDDMESTLGSWMQAQEGRTDFDHVFRLKNPDGIRWVRGRATPLLDDKHELIGFIGTINDITQIKEAESASHEAKLRAEEATKAKSQFLSMMSHEIRTPMNAIIGLTNLMLSENPRSDQEDHLKLLKFSGENLLTIINDILDFSKIEAGKITLERVDFNLQTLTSNIYRILEQRAKEKKISLQLHYDEKLPSIVRGDQVRIAQVITNLLGNAIKFTEAGYVELRVSLLEQKDSQVTILFSITDSGIGIEPEKMKLIFEGFSQANADTTRRFGGTGLGLSITKRLLNLMDSDVAVKSEPGKGSTFSFVLRLERGEKRENISSESVGKSFAFGDGAIRILLVEDNKVNQIVAANFLKKWNVQVHFANNGREAFEMIKTKSYQLVLMDLQMPEMDGYEATRMIRTLTGDPYFRNIPIIALTASAMLDVQDKVRSSGMNDFLTKPFSPDELKSKIARYVSANDSSANPDAITLDPYVDGDPVYKAELSELLIKNIEEFQKSLAVSIKKGDPKIFGTACHKIKTTLGILADKDFLKLIDSIKEEIARQPGQTQSLVEKQSMLKRKSSELIRRLQRS